MTLNNKFVSLTLMAFAAACSAEQSGSVVEKSDVNSIAYDPNHIDASTAPEKDDPEKNDLEPTDVSCGPGDSIKFVDVNPERIQTPGVLASTDPKLNKSLQGRSWVDSYSTDGCPDGSFKNVKWYSNHFTFKHGVFYLKILATPVNGGPAPQVSGFIHTQSGRLGGSDLAGMTDDYDYQGSLKRLRGDKNSFSATSIQIPDPVNSERTRTAYEYRVSEQGSNTGYIESGMTYESDLSFTSSSCFYLTAIASRSPELEFSDFSQFSSIHDLKRSGGGNFGAMSGFYQCSQRSHSINHTLTSAATETKGFIFNSVKSRNPSEDASRIAGYSESGTEGAANYGGYADLNINITNNSGQCQIIKYAVGFYRGDGTHPSQINYHGINTVAQISQDGGFGPIQHVYVGYTTSPPRPRQPLQPMIFPNGQLTYRLDSGVSFSYQAKVMMPPLNNVENGLIIQSKPCQ